MTGPLRWLRRLGLLGMAAVCAGAMTAAPGPALAAPGGAAPTPVMGWSSWSFFRGGINEKTVVAQANAMHASLQSHGYQYVNIDSGWTDHQDAFGRRVWNTSKFPSGMPALASRLHGMGLKLGIYLTPGINRTDVANNVPVFGTKFHAKDFADTSANGNTSSHPTARIDFSKPGSHEYIQSLADLYASWGVDYIKMDFVGPGGGVNTADNRTEIQVWHQAILNTGRKIVLELSNSLSFANASTWQAFANGWRIDGDIECYSCQKGTGTHFPLTSWAKLSLRFSDLPKWVPFAGPGNFNDLDSLEIGAGSHDGLTTAQRRTAVTLWSIASAPIIIGADLTHLDSGDLHLITNDEVLAVDQAAISAAPLHAGGTQQVWRSKQADGTYVVALFNLSTSATSTVSVTWAQLGFNRPAAVRDLWSHSNLGTQATGFSASLGPGATRLVRVTPQ
jgi:hypothetical protein